MNPTDVFVTESNADLYLSKLHDTLDPTERDNLLRLLAKEEAAMGTSREHVEIGERRVLDGRQRVEKQRMLVAESEDRAAEQFRLELLEKTQVLLEEHLRLLRVRREQTKL